MGRQKERIGAARDQAGETELIVEWLPAAQRDFDDLVDYIAADHPSAASQAGIGPSVLPRRDESFFTRANASRFRIKSMTLSAC